MAHISLKPLGCDASGHHHHHRGQAFHRSIAVSTVHQPVVSCVLLCAVARPLFSGATLSSSVLVQIENSYSTQLIK